MSCPRRTDGREVRGSVTLASSAFRPLPGRSTCRMPSSSNLAGKADDFLDIGSKLRPRRTGS